MTPTYPRFITFEGPEGAGKSTQCRLLADWLKQRGVDVLVTRQPGGDPVGQKLRAILLDSGTDGAAVTARAEVLMMMADRNQSVAHVIRPHLDSGGTVICDRYADSSIAYQGYGRRLNLSVVSRLNVFATETLMPDLTILLDIDPGVGIARQPVRTKMESEALDFHRRVRNGFLQIAAKEPSRVVVIDASGEIEAIAQAVRQVYETHYRDRAGAK